MIDGKLTGSCLCGAIRYEITRGPEWAHNCHCSRCRKATGASFASNLFVPLGGLHYTIGEELLRWYRPPDAERFTHTFCSICGSTLPFENRARGRVVIPMGTLDDDPGCGPQAHIFVDSRAPWTFAEDDLTRHPAALGSGS